MLRKEDRNMPTSNQAPPKVHTRGEVIRAATENYLNSLNMTNLPAPEVIQENILTDVETALMVENAMRDKGNKFRIPHELLPVQIAMIFVKLYPIAKISSGMEKGVEDYDVLAIYQDSGPDEGIYVTDEKKINNLIRTYSFTANQRTCEETIAILNDTAPRVEPCRDPDLIPVNNGIFNYKSKQLLPFTPKLVFTSKSRVDYNPNATNPIIPTPDGDWDIESWILDLFDDPELADLAWDIAGAIIRPNNPWGKAALFYATTGNNGKGTLAQFYRNLCGEGTYASISLADMGKEFMLESLVRSSAIIVDENDVGIYIDKAANLKAIITNDVLLINRKHKAPIAVRPRGFMVQCLNEMPRVKDKSDSFYRRQLFVPFTKSFTGRERKYIKNELLFRQDVLEYALRKVLELMPDYYALPEPEACKIALEDYKEFNNPVQSFLNEMLPLLVWDLVPWAFLYDLFKAWFQKTNPSGSIQGRNTFINDVKSLLSNWPEWQPTNPRDGMRTGNKMNEPEPLIEAYDLTDWMNPTYIKSTNVSMKCRPFLNEKYIGMFRIKNESETA